MNRVAINVSMQVSLYYNILNSFRIIFRWGIANSNGISSFHFWRKLSLDFHMVLILYISTNSEGEYNFSISSSICYCHFFLSFFLHSSIAILIGESQCHFPLWLKTMNTFSMYLSSTCSFDKCPFNSFVHILKRVIGFGMLISELFVYSKC